ncbi:PKD domain-containing protein [Massilia sp. PAMC28688]|uniref:PKD domain-containing protein n=1 Tax=Massilia sp. PAMC28688 TaxID=2861283 RepID=UPI001C627CB6|nr:PKD domain-containing protein [Massilia sp. PAMC28688]QYF95378.1 PKD domain-containing protein [Massilia sp. PAMC28688]
MFAKNFSQRSRLACAAALALAVLTGCGGGGGGDSSPPVVNNAAPVTTMLLSGVVSAGVDGADATTGLTNELILSGSSSTDANGDTLTYKWSIVSKPAGSVLALAQDTNVKQVIRADIAGTYVLALRVTDSKGAFSEKKVTILVHDNVAPVSNVVVTATYAGQTTTAPTQSLHVGSAVVLDAKGSRDADGDAVTTTWTMLEKPAGSAASLAIDGAISRFVADAAGLYKVRAHGVDPKGAYSETVYTFNADNNAPTTVMVASAIPAVASEGYKLTVPSGYLVSLESSSWGHNGGTVSHAWTLVSKPETSQSILSTTGTAIAQIKPDVLGQYVLRLTATDAAGAISSQLSTITVKNHSPLSYLYSNVAPVAMQHGPAVRLALNSPVTLRSSNSTDADGDTLTHTWTLTGKPSASKAELSATTGTEVQLSADVAGAYVVLLRVTDSQGAYSEKSMTFNAGSYPPVAVIDKNFATVLLGNAASASAALSFDQDSGALTYSWAIDSAPAGSTATIAAPAAANLAFTPDVAGEYTASVTVSDGVNTNVGYLTIRALASMVANVELNFMPLEARYSKGLDQLVVLSTNPNAVKIVNPFSGLVKTAVLPSAGVSLNLSPDGTLALVVQQNIVSLIDVSTGTLIRSTSTDAAYSEGFVNNSGIAHLLGRSVYTSGSYGMAILDARTGTDMTAALQSSNSLYLTENYRGLYAAKRNRVFLSQNSGYITSLEIDGATGKVGAATNSGYLYETTGQLYMTDNEDILFTSSGTMYRADTLKSAGKLTFTGLVQSLSHSSSNDETLIMPYTFDYYNANGRTYSSSIHRYVGGLFVADTNLALPAINGQQSYGIQIHHSAAGRHVALVQTMSANQNGAGLKYYVLVR